jgi:uncharacterized membrane protein YozB (DUF420 family)
VIGSHLNLSPGQIPPSHVLVDFVISPLSHKFHCFVSLTLTTTISCHLPPTAFTATASHSLQYSLVMWTHCCLSIACLPSPPYCFILPSPRLCHIPYSIVQSCGLTAVSSLHVDPEVHTVCSMPLWALSCCQPVAVSESGS